MSAFTVVLPLYNQAQYVSHALGSVLSQTCQDAEVIVIDDGSTDGGSQVVQSMADARVTLVRQTNQGVSSARNRGIEMATGDYIAFIDADDEWLPSFLECNLGFIKKYPSVTTVYTNVIEGRNDRARIDGSVCPEGIVPDYFLSVLRCHRHLGIPSAAVARREALCKVGGFPTGVKYNEDHDLWMRLAWVGKVGFIAEPLSLYRDNPSGAMSRMRINGVPYPYPVLTYRRWKSQGRIPANLLKSSWEFVNWTLLGYVCNLADAGDSGAARRVLLKECGWTTKALRSYTAALLLCAAPPVGKILWRRHLKSSQSRFGSPGRQAYLLPSNIAVSQTN
jgi:Glycosyl transferase family 2